MASNVKPVDFFLANPVFRFEDFVAVHAGSGDRSRQTSATVLKQHVRAGNLLHVRRGLYAVVPRGISPDSFQVSGYLLASRLSPDAVIAYHTALQFHGKAHSISRRFTYLTVHRNKRFQFRGAEYVPVLVPAVLRDLKDWGGGIADEFHAGLAIRVTTLERTLVDVLDNLRYGGGWEETFRSLESAGFFDLDAVIEYALKMRKAVTVARVGFFLEMYREQLMVEDQHLDALSKHAPSCPMYLDRRKREPGKLQARWNLIVPEYVLNRSWEEVL